MYKRIEARLKKGLVKGIVITSRKKMKSFYQIYEFITH